MLRGLLVLAISLGAHASARPSPSSLGFALGPLTGIKHTSTTLQPSPLTRTHPRSRPAGGPLALRASEEKGVGRREALLLGSGWLLAAGVPLVGGARGAGALPSPLQRYTDECEVDACINRDRRVFTRAGRKFTIKQEFDKNGSKSTGSAVWEGDVVLTKYMDGSMPREYWQGKKVLELGAGIGLAGMVAVLLGAGKVVLTDGDAKVLDLAKVNAEANLTPEEIKEGGLRYEKLRWEWAADEAWRYDDGDKKPIDVILAADLTYYKDNIPPLMRMIRRLCSPNTEVLLSHTVRPTDGDSMQQFYKFFNVDKINSGPAFEGHPETFMYRLKAKSKAELGDADDKVSDGCRPGYKLKKEINLCVPAS